MTTATQNVIKDFIGALASGDRERAQTLARFREINREGIDPHEAIETVAAIRRDLARLEQMNPAAMEKAQRTHEAHIDKAQRRLEKAQAEYKAALAAAPPSDESPAVYWHLVEQLGWRQNHTLAWRACAPEVKRAGLTPEKLRKLCRQAHEYRVAQESRRMTRTKP